jgi:hypothetical protein
VAQGHHRHRNRRWRSGSENGVGEGQGSTRGCETSVREQYLLLVGTEIGRNGSARGLSFLGEQGPDPARRVDCISQFRSKLRAGAGELVDNSREEVFLSTLPCGEVPIIGGSMRPQHLDPQAQMLDGLSADRTTSGGPSRASDLRAQSFDLVGGASSSVVFCPTFAGHLIGALERREMLAALERDPQAARLGGHHARGADQGLMTVQRQPQIDFLVLTRSLREAASSRTRGRRLLPSAGQLVKVGAQPLEFWMVVSLVNAIVQGERVRDPSLGGQVADSLQRQNAGFVGLQPGTQLGKQFQVETTARKRGGSTARSAVV